MYYNCVFSVKMHHRNIAMGTPPTLPPTVPIAPCLWLWQRSIHRSPPQALFPHLVAALASDNLSTFFLFSFLFLWKKIKTLLPLNKWSSIIEGGLSAKQSSEGCKFPVLFITLHCFDGGIYQGQKQSRPPIPLLFDQSDYCFARVGAVTSSRRPWVGSHDPGPLCVLFACSFCSRCA